MNYKFFYRSLLRILFTPGKAWDAIIDENRPDRDLRIGFLFPFIIMISLAAFLGSLLFFNITLSTFYSIFTGIRYLLLFLFLPFVSAIILSEITIPLDLGKNFTVSFRLIVYSLTPFFICQITSLLFESLIFVNVLSLYGLYIFWTGAEKILAPPQYKKIPLLIATCVEVAGVYYTGNSVLSSITDRIFHSFFA
jgi:hypothetical protein